MTSSITLRQALALSGEAMPAWLNTVQERTSLDISLFLTGGRIVYYPGCGTDGQPIAAFNSAHAAHCFVYVDYGLKRKVITDELTARGFTGYRSLAKFELNEGDSGLLDKSGQDYFVEDEASRPPAPIEKFGFFEIFERTSEEGEKHGASRFVILFLGADGFVTFKALFCGVTRAAPFCIVLQDHGFGGNWNHFGKGGKLEELAASAKVRPDLLLVGSNTQVWNGYQPCEGVLPERGGMHTVRRYLCRRR